MFVEIYVALIKSKNHINAFTQLERYLANLRVIKMVLFCDNHGFLRDFIIS